MIWHVKVSVPEFEKSPPASLIYDNLAPKNHFYFLFYFFLFVLFPLFLTHVWSKGPLSFFRPHLSSILLKKSKNDKNFILLKAHLTRNLVVFSPHFGTQGNIFTPTYRPTRRVFWSMISNAVFLKSCSKRLFKLIF